MRADGWLGVELRHLAALQAVAEESSFGRAAERLGYTQSAVSQQIQALERVVGQRLVERPGGPRRVSLTEAGELLLRHAAGIVARLQAAQADLAAFAEGSAGTLRVGTFQSVGARVLPRLLRTFTETWPDVSIQLTEAADDGALLDLVERGELDFTFVMLPAGEGPFESFELMRDPYVVVLPTDSPLATRAKPPSLREVAAMPLIGNRQCRSVHQIENRFRDAGLEPRIVFRSDDNGTIQELVAAGVGAALALPAGAGAYDMNGSVRSAAIAMSTAASARDPYVVVLPADSPLATRPKPPSLREVAAMPLIGNRQCRSVHQIENRFRDAGLEPRIVFRSDDNGTIHELVAAGVGAALVPLLTVDPNHDGTVVIGLAWHRDRYRSPAARAFVDLAAEVCARVESDLMGETAAAA